MYVLLETTFLKIVCKEMSGTDLEARRVGSGSSRAALMPPVPFST